MRNLLKSLFIASILSIGVSAIAQDAPGAPAGQPGGRMGRMGGGGMPDGMGFAPATMPGGRAGRMGGMAPARADVASPRSDANSQKAHEQLVEKAKNGKGKIDLYFLGDSITRRWGGTDYPTNLDNFKRNFWGWNAGNFGWGADLTQNILWRIQNGELDDVNPKVIVLLAGTNNINARMGDANVTDIVNGIKAIIKTCQEKAPKATIILLGITPRNDNMADMPIINQVNEQLEKLADGKTLRFLNVNDKFADNEGKLFDGLTIDRLHPDIKGYQIIADALTPLLTELLGPKALIDHAPPATGDPSAAKPVQPEPKDPFIPPTK